MFLCNVWLRSFVHLSQNLQPQVSQRQLERQNRLCSVSYQTVRQSVTENKQIHVNVVCILFHWLNNFCKFWHKCVNTEIQQTWTCTHMYAFHENCARSNLVVLWTMLQYFHLLMYSFTCLKEPVKKWCKNGLWMQMLLYISWFTYKTF